MVTRPHSYVQSAPQELVRQHEQREINKGYAQLEALLTDPGMEWGWRELAKQAARARIPDFGSRLFREVVHILHQLNPRNTALRLRRSENRDKLLEVGEIAEELASRLNDGHLDKQAYEYFPAELMQINGSEHWDRLNSLEKAAVAHEILRSWPTFPEMLRELAAHARKLAQEAMEHTRVIERQHGNESDRQRYFVRALVAYMRREYGSPLYGTVARVSNAVLGTAFIKRDVERLARGSK